MAQGFPMRNCVTWKASDISWASLNHASVNHIGLEKMTEEAQATEGVENADVVTEGGDPLLQEDGGRPEWLPEKFNSPEDLATGYSNLEQKLGQKDEEVRNAVMKEIEETAFADRPESVGDYQLPEGFDMEQADGNELLQWWAETSFENGYSNEEFQKGVSMYMDALNANVPDYDAELSKLGDNATARTEAVSLFANQFFAEEHLGAIERMCETADGVLALEHIMENMRQDGPSGTGMPAAQTNEAELKQMMLDPRYHDPVRRDASFIKQVDEGFKRLYG